jgi:hypothetical protein
MKILYACVFLVACKSSDAKQAADAVPCVTGAAELSKQLHTANGYNMDLSDPKTQPAILGKRFAFKDCKFTSQGNDTVSFAGAADQRDIGCVMAGGEAGNKKFRTAAMDFDMAKLKLDVTGVVKLHDGDLEMIDCKITPHE